MPGKFDGFGFKVDMKTEQDLQLPHSMPKASASSRIKLNQQCFKLNVCQNQIKNFAEGCPSYKRISIRNKYFNLLKLNSIHTATYKYKS